MCIQMIGFAGRTGLRIRITEPNFLLFSRDFPLQIALQTLNDMAATILTRNYAKNDGIFQVARKMNFSWIIIYYYHDF